MGVWGLGPQNKTETPRQGCKATEQGRPKSSGGAGNRTRVLCRLAKASPCAVHTVSTWLPRSRELAGVTSPVAVCFPDLTPRPGQAVSPLDETGDRAEGTPGPAIGSLSLSLDQAARATSR